MPIEDPSFENVPLSAWKLLFQSAIEFQNAGIWKWMKDRDIFGIHDPKSKEYCLCSVLGNAGECYGLALYPGNKGLITLQTIMNPDLMPEENREFHIDIQSLVLNIGERNELQPGDLELIQKLGLNFSSNQWIFFRSHKPGLVPTLPDNNEVEFMTSAIQQSLQVGQRMKNDPMLIHSSKKDYYLCRVLENGSWNDEWVRLVPRNESFDFSAHPVNEIKLQRIKERQFLLKNIWEIDQFYLTNPVKAQKNHPAFFPQIMLIIDKDSFYVIGQSLAENNQQKINTFREYFLDMLLQSSFKPERIHYQHEEIREILEPITGQIDIQMIHQETLPAINDVKKEMGQHFSMHPINRKQKQEIGRNDPCPCGSGKKYKKCCGQEH